MAELERLLVPGPGQSLWQKIHVLHGLGGMGKTQLAVEFARCHHRRFSSVFWLERRSEDTLKRSTTSHASRIPPGQIAEADRTYALTAALTHKQRLSKHERCTLWRCQGSLVFMVNRGTDV
jgi:hypothetical protein